MLSRQQYPHRPEPARASVIGRQRTRQLAAVDTGQALKMARVIPDAWYRVQALAYVAEHADERSLLPILEEAARTARSCHDAYGTVAVMSWPLEIAFRRGRIKFAEPERAKCLALAAEVEPRESQAYALQLLWGGCYAADPVHAGPVWTRILELCHPDRSWRSARLYLHIAQVQDSRTPGAAAAVIGAMAPGKAKLRLERRFRLPRHAAD